MKRIYWLLLIILSLTVVPAAIHTPTVQAQDPAVEIINQEIDSRFRDAITAQLAAEHQSEITNVEFFYRIVGERATARNVAEFEPGTSIEASYSIAQDRQETYMPPGTEIEYWWKITDVDGNSLKTEPETYLYLDNRYDFKTLQNERLTLYWYNGGRAFGDSLFNQANKALNQLEADVGVTLERPIKIFIYGTHEDLISALSISAQEWTGGVAFSEEGVVVIGVRADNLDWGLKAMTHELTHLVIHQATDNPYGDLPRWLDEGLAVYNENPEGLDEQFFERFQEAVENDALMTLQTLSSTFPADPEAANLAYGQSGAVVHFIIRQYGNEAMKELLEIFSEGSLYDDALEAALGEDTQSLDNAFRARWELDPIPGTEPTQAETQTDQSQTEESQSAEPEPEAAEDTSQPAAEEQTDQQAAVDEAAEAEDSGGGLNIPCIGGLLPLAALGILLTNRRRRLFG